MQLLKEQLMAKGTDVGKVQLQKKQLETQRELVNSRYEQVMNALRFAMGVLPEQQVIIEKEIPYKINNEYTSTAAVDIRLIPFEEIRQDTVGVQENAYQKRQDILKGISYFAIEQAKEGMEHSINPEKIASPVWSVSVNSKRTVVKKKKVIEFA